MNDDSFVMITFRCSLLVLSISCLSSYCAAQELSELALFKALAGKRVESGELVPQANAQPIPGKAVSVGTVPDDGKGFQIRGSAVYEPVKWDYLWHFVFDEGRGKGAVSAIYKDSMGQQIPYQGLYDAENQQVQLVAKLKGGGNARIIYRLEASGVIRISSLIADANNTPMVTYSAQNVAAE
ncbi:MAG: hypothetical protein P1U68_14100 [Verrucomicrobiales bacterium]|nr:hypothetical protein [Verrucomicrobiales bacterium]